MTVEEAILAAEAAVRQEFRGHRMLEDILQEARLYVVQAHAAGRHYKLSMVIGHVKNYLQQPGVREESAGYLRERLAGRVTRPVEYPTRLSVRVSPAIERAIIKYQRKRQISMSDALREVILRGLNADNS